MNEQPAANRGLAMVFQSYALYPYMTVREDLVFGLGSERTKRIEPDERIVDAVRMPEIATCLARRPSELPARLLCPRPCAGGRRWVDGAVIEGGGS